MKVIKNKSKLELISIAIIIMWLTGYFYLTMKYSLASLNADMSSELVLANHLANINKFISPKWYYSTEIRLLNTQLISMPLFKIFSDWTLVRAITNLILQVILVGSYLFLMKQLKVKRDLSLFTSIFLLIPVTHTYYLVVLFGSFYIPHISILFVFLGMYILLTEGKICNKYMKYFLMLTYIVLAFINGVSGIRYILIIAVPLMVTILYMLIRSKEYDFLKKKYSHDALRGLIERFKKHLIWGIVSIVVAGIGYLVNGKYLSKIFKFASYNNIKFVDFTQQSFLETVNTVVINSVLRYFGCLPDGAEVISLVGIKILLMLVCLATLGYMFTRAYLRCKEQKEKDTKGDMFILVFSGVTFVVNTFVFIFTSSDFTSRYYIPVLIMFVPILAVYLKNECYIVEKKILSLILIIGFLLSGAVSVQGITTTSYNKDRLGSIEYLTDNNFTFGYASFWNANIITEITDGEVKVASVSSFETLAPYYWLTLKEYFDVDREGKSFILLSNKEVEESKNNELLKQGKVNYSDDKYTIYEYPDYSTISNAFNEVK